MNPNPILDRIIARETYAEMLATLTPQQLAVVALRLDGLSWIAAEQVLGITRGCAYQRMLGPRHRLPQQFPHLLTMLGGDS